MNDLDIRLDKMSPVPLYHQLARQLEGAVENGRLPKGEFLGNEIELAEVWRVSRPTVRRAIQELVDNGLLMRRRGIGTQVVNDQVRRKVKLSSLFDDLREQGRAPTTRVLVLERVPATRDVAETLELAAGTDVIHIERCRSAGSIRLAILRNWLPADIVGDISAEALENGGLYQLLRQRGIRPHYATQRIGAVVASPAEAKTLDLAVGAPLLTMRRVMQSDSGVPVELGDHFYDAAHYSVEMTVLEN